MVAPKSLLLELFDKGFVNGYGFIEAIDLYASRLPRGPNTTIIHAHTSWE